MTASNLLPVISTWGSGAAVIVAVAVGYHTYLSDDEAKAFATRVQMTLRAGPSKWAEEINSLFLAIFDYIYGSRGSTRDRLLWISIFGPYLILLIARIILLIFKLPTPKTEAILLASILISLACSLFGEFFVSAHAVARAQEAKPLPFIKLVTNVPAMRAAVCLSGTTGLLTFVTGMIVFRYDGSLWVLVAVITGGIVACPTVLLLSLIPPRALPVGPLRAVLSSLIVMVILALHEPTASSVFLSDLLRGNWGLFGFIAFNIFGDAVSLVETRVILRWSRGAPLRTLLSLLLLDSILSAGIYMVLPELAHQDLNILWQGIAFKGPQPWLGILFWSTFLTSLMFYGFLASVVLLNLCRPLIRCLNFFFEKISIERYPVAALTLSALFLWTIGLLALASVSVG
jgi:hypothetical protein